MIQIIQTWLVTILFLAIAASSDAQQAKPLPRIGYLSASTRVSHAPSFAAFWQGLRELSYVEGKNIGIEARFAEGKVDRLPELVSELIQLKVDVLLVGGSEAVIDGLIFLSFQRRDSPPFPALTGSA